MPNENPRVTNDMYIKKKRTLETFIPNLSANLDDTAKPCFSKKYLKELIQFNGYKF